MPHNTNENKDINFTPPKLKDSDQRITPTGVSDYFKDDIVVSDKNEIDAINDVMQLNVIDLNSTDDEFDLDLDQYEIFPDDVKADESQMILSEEDLSNPLDELESSLNYTPMDMGNDLNGNLSDEVYGITKIDDEPNNFLLDYEFRRDMSDLSFFLTDSDKIGNKLIQAAQDGNLSIIKDLSHLHHGCFEPKDFDSALYEAVFRNNYELVDHLLIYRTAFIGMTFDPSKSYVLTTGNLWNGTVSLPIIKRLIHEFGRQTFNKNSLGIPALVTACMYSQTEIVKILLEKGANPNERCENIYQGLHLFSVALTFAVYNADLEMAIQLLRFGANPNIVESYFHDPFYIAMTQKNYLIAKVLLSFGYNVSTMYGQHQSMESALMLINNVENLDVKQDLRNTICNESSIVHGISENNQVSFRP